MPGKRLITAEQIAASKARRRAWDRARHERQKDKRNSARKISSVKNPDLVREKERSRYAANPGRKKKNDVHSRYGKAAYEVFLATHTCEACGCDVSGRNKHIDHDHSKPKTFRGILCSACNVALGHLKEDETRILGLLNYLKTKGVKS